MDSKRLVEGAGICIGEAAASPLHPMERGPGGEVARPAIPTPIPPSPSDGRDQGKSPLRVRIETDPQQRETGVLRKACFHEI